MEKLAVRSIVITLISIVVLIGAIACREAPPQEEALPQEAAPPQEVLGRIQIKVMSSTWREGEKPYDICSAISDKLEEVGFAVAPEGSNAYDAVLLVDYEEGKGSEYYWTANHLPTDFGGFGTSIHCKLELYDKDNHLLWDEEIRAGTSQSVRDSLYNSAVKNFKSRMCFKYLGDIIAVQYGSAPGSEDYRRKLEALIQALKYEDTDGSMYFRGDAALALGKIGDARAVEPLIEMLNKDEDWYVRSCVAEALGDIGDARAVEVLTEALSDEDFSVQTAAQEALGKIERHKE